MKKYILFSVFLFLTVGAFPQNHPDELFEIHYDYEHVGGVGSPNTDFIIAAKLTAEKLAPYEGYNLIAVKVYINNAVVGNTGYVNVYAAGSYTDPGPILMSVGPVHVDSNAWNTIDLPSAVNIPPSDLWIGFEALAGPSGSHSWAGCDAGPNDPDGQFIYFKGTWYRLTALGSSLTYNWNIRAVIETVSDIKNDLPPAGFTLSQNYPNPFNPNTKISITLLRNSFVTFKVYNIMGKEISVLMNRELLAGKHDISFNASGLPGGVYFYKLRMYSSGKPTRTETKKMLLIK
jgi:hypothetical protein